MSWLRPIRDYDPPLEDARWRWAGPSHPRAERARRDELLGTPMRLVSLHGAHLAIDAAGQAMDGEMRRIARVVVLEPLRGGERRAALLGLNDSIVRLGLAGPIAAREDGGNAIPLTPAEVIAERRGGA